MTDPDTVADSQSNIDKCEKSPDGIHCVHWWDGEPCDYCGADGELVNDDGR